jgi:hypothetical protein
MLSGLEQFGDVVESTLTRLHGPLNFEQSQHRICILAGSRSNPTNAHTLEKVDFFRFIYVQ